MDEPAAQIESRPRTTWTIADFSLIWLGGLVGTGVFFAIASLVDSDDWAIVAGLAGQYVGNLGVFWMLFRKKGGTSLGFEIVPRDTLYIGLGLVLQLAMALLFLPLSELLFPDGRPPQEVADAIANADSSAVLKISLVAAAVVLAPVTEELLFRGVLLRALRRHSQRLIIVITATAFALIHVLGLDFDRFWGSAAVVLPPIFLLGLMLAWMTLRTGRLGPAIFLHSGWNLLAALVLLIPSELLEGA